MRDIIELLAGELDRRRDQIENVVTLLDEGNTIPFIARYRKELHGAMDDGALRKLEERLAYLRSLEERCAVIKKAIEAQGCPKPEGPCPGGSGAGLSQPGKRGGDRGGRPGGGLGHHRGDHQ